MLLIACLYLNWAQQDSKRQKGSMVEHCCLVEALIWATSDTHIAQLNDESKTSSNFYVDW